MDVERDGSARPHGSDVRVVLVDDHNVVRTGLGAVLKSEGFEVVGEARSGEECLTVVRDLFGGRSDRHPNIVVMDLMMPGMGGIEATKRLKEAWPDLPVLVLTMNDDRAYLRDAFRAGASGYVMKDAIEDEFVDATKVVASGGRYLHPRLMAELGAEMLKRQAPLKGVELSEREQDVVRLVAQGYSNKEIAEALFLSVRTVETHKTHIIQKTGLRARSELTRFAQEAGILDP